MNFEFPPVPPIPNVLDAGFSSTLASPAKRDGMACVLKGVLIEGYNPVIGRRDFTISETMKGNEDLKLLNETTGLFDDYQGVSGMSVGCAQFLREGDLEPDPSHSKEYSFVEVEEDSFISLTGTINEDAIPKGREKSIEWQRTQL